MFVLALIPIPYLYLINIVGTAIGPGILFGLGARLSFNKALIIILGSLPHMLVELLGLCLFASAIYPINLWIRRKIFRQRLLIHTKLVYELKVGVIRYVKYVLPAMLLAAVLETYVADWLFSLLTKVLES